MEEEWKDFPGFEEKYQISNLGRVKRKETMLKNSVGVYCHKNEKILKTQIMKIGYPSIVLRDDSGKKHLIKIHRAVVSGHAAALNDNKIPQGSARNGAQVGS